MKTTFEKIEIGCDFFVEIPLLGKVRYNKISARKAKTFQGSKFITKLFGYKTTVQIAE